MVNFRSGHTQINKILSNFHFGSGSFNSGEHISGVGSGMGPGHSVRVSGLGSVLPGLVKGKFKREEK